MKFSQLPREITDEILAYAFLVRGQKRGMRLRLVNKAFSNDLKDTIYAQCLLDEYFMSHCVGKHGRIPPFTASYLAARVLNRRARDLNSAKIIREVAQRLTDEVGDLSSDCESKDKIYRGHVTTLCQLVVDYGDLDYFFQRRSKIKCTNENIAYGFLVAAAYLNIPALTKKLILPGRNYYSTHKHVAPLFGTPVSHVLRHGSLALLQHFTPEEHMVQYEIGVYHGSLPCTMYLYETSMRPSNFHYDPDKGWVLSSTSAADSIWDASELVLSQWKQALPNKWIVTPTPEVFEFALRLRQNTAAWSDQQIGSNLMGKLLGNCAKENWIEMARYLLEKHSADVNGEYKGETALQIACTHNRRAVIDMLLDHGADPKGALKRAASHGHLDLVVMLINRGVKMPRSIIGKPVAYGNLPLAKVLLEHGTIPSDGAVHPLVEAVSAENVKIFELLLSHGAVLDSEVREMCVQRAEAEGLESMMEYLSRWEPKLDDGRVCARVPRGNLLARNYPLDPLEEKAWYKLL
ncbi:hypothetical protein SLS60_005306 [Paraconiothyrium brasiliense]|uniref:Ankyrin repeat protein n=1 Tax=Paraconiothyrium brasiliense TaxID=300254 RepID=A0ABR3RGZ5_9PLEO